MAPPGSVGRRRRGPSPLDDSIRPWQPTGSFPADEPPRSDRSSTLVPEPRWGTELFESPPVPPVPIASAMVEPHADVL